MREAGGFRVRGPGGIGRGLRASDAARGQHRPRPARVGRGAWASGKAKSANVRRHRPRPARIGRGMCASCRRRRPTTHRKADVGRGMPASPVASTVSRGRPWTASIALRPHATFSRRGPPVALGPHATFTRRGPPVALGPHATFSRRRPRAARMGRGLHAAVSHGLPASAVACATMVSHNVSASRGSFVAT
ncbi:hypothetical protein KY290_013286 [Solanum tuberosum]|uniref:Uncharacterized protein n=1 Tax=Solanum tuberosum TaxID=4113 RepID=A0ABQ7VNE1_SOLTU|nr:hypothetical protein KY290_013286 [Solanum tuberosum]